MADAEQKPYTFGQRIYNYGPMFLVLMALFASLITFGLTNNSNHNSSNRKEIGIMLGIITVIIFIFTLLIYFYFSLNSAYTNFYIIVISNLVILISIGSITITAYKVDS